MKKIIAVSFAFLIGIGTFVIWKQKHSFLSVLPSKGELKVLAYTPSSQSQDAQEVPISQDGVSVMFDRAMIPLTTLDQQKEIPLEISPKIDGSFHWLGTHGFIFRPKTSWAPATTYTVTLPKGLRSEDGYTLKEDLVWEFQTVSPRVTNDNVETATLLPSQSTIFIRFNMSMNRDDVAKKITITSEKGAVENNLEWIDDDHILQIKFIKPLPWSDSIKVKIPSGTLSSYGSIGIQKDFEKKWITPSQDMKIVRVWNFASYQDETPLVPDRENQAPAGSSVCYEFSQPIFKKSFEKAFHVEKSAAAPYFYFSYYQTYPVVGTDGKVSDREGYTRACAVFLEKHFTTYTFSLKSEDIQSLSGAPLTQKSALYKIKTSHADPEIYSNLTKTILSYDGAMKLSYRAINVKNIQAKLYRIPDLLNYSEQIKNASLESYANKELSFAEIPLHQNKWSLPLSADMEIDETRLKSDYHQSLDLMSEPDQSQAFQVDLNQFAEGRPAPGVYLLEILGKDASNQKTGSTVSLIQLSPTGIALKRDTDHILIWTTQLESGLPQATHYKIHAFSSRHEPVLTQEGTTDAQGLASIKIPPSTLDIGRLCVTLPDTSNITCESDHKFPDYRYTQSTAPYYFAYVYTDRPIYRPGQKVFFSSFIRQVWESRYLRADPKTACEVSIKDAAGMEIYKNPCTLGAAGVVSGSVDLENDEDLSRGNYEVTLTVNKQTFTRTFQVTSYHKPSFKVDIKSDLKEIVSHDTLKAHVVGSYFFGAPLKKAKTQWSLMTSTYIFSPENYADYTFIDPDLLIAKTASGVNGIMDEESDDENYVSDYEYSWVGSSFQMHVSEDSSTYDDPRFSGENKSYANQFYKSEGKNVENIPTTLNTEGVLDIEHKPDLSKYPTSQILTLEASVSDAAHQEVSTSEDFIVHKAHFYLGIKPEKWIYGEKEKSVFHIVSLQPGKSGKTENEAVTPEPKKSFSATLIKRDYSYVEKRNAHGFWELMYEPKDTEIKSIEGKTDSSGKADITFDIPSGGSYRVVLKAKDSASNQVQSATDFYAWGKGYVPWKLNQPEAIELVPDKDHYAVGEKAKILIKSLVPMTKAWLTYERGHVLESKIIDLGGQNAPHLEIPITEGMIPNMYIGVVAHVGRDATRPPLLFRGETELHIAPETKRLQISLTPDRISENAEQPPIYRPGDTVKVHVETKTPEGKPQKSHVIISVADESVLKLLNYKQPDLIQKFYYNRSNNVRSASSLTSLKAGDGGMGAVKKRRIFKDTAHFESHLMTGDNGSADFSFKLPDDLTTWVIEAVAITDSKLMTDFEAEKQNNWSASDLTFVGSQRSKIMSTQPLVLRTALPRFLAWGDQVKGSLIANNRSAQDLKGKLQLKVTGDSTLEKNEIPFEIKAFSESTFPIAITVGQQPFTLSATALVDSSETLNHDLNDALEVTLPILDRFEPEVVATSGLTQTGEEEKLELPTALSDRGGLTISFKASLSLSSAKSLKNLIYYPYGCSEQKSAHLLALLIANHLAETLGTDYLQLISPLTEAEIKSGTKLNQRIEDLLKDLHTYQNTDGGMKYWPESYASNDFPSTQTYWALMLAQNQGYDVDVDMLSLLKTYLTRNVQKENHKTPDTVAHTLWALSFENEDPNFPLWVAEELFAQKEKLSINALTDLAITYKNKNRLDRAKSLEDRIVTLSKQDPRQVSWPESSYFWSSTLKNTARASTALLEIDPQHPFLAKSMAYLFERKNIRNAPSSTQDDLALAWFAYRASQVFAQDKTEFSARMTMDSKTLAETTFDERNLLTSFQSQIPMKDLMAAGPAASSSPSSKASLQIQKSGSGTLYYDLELKYYLENPPTREEGLMVSRNYYALDDTEEKHPLTEFKVGENYKGHITVVSPHDLNYVLIQDLLPSGFEPIDMNLSISSNAARIQSQRAPQQDKASDFEDPFFASIYQAYDDIATLADYGTNVFFSHQEIRDSTILWSDETIPAGTYHIRYPIRATSAGTFTMPGAKAFEFYQPEIFGRSQARKITIRD